ncbi:MAG: ATP-binding protein [Ginsengibacter sp.]
MNTDSSNIIVIVFGLPGSGKSYFAERLAKKIHATYINSDQSRMEMYKKRTYSETEKKAVYHAMLDKMNDAISQNKSVILDATFHKESTRNIFTKKAPGKILFMEVWADDAIIRERLKKERVLSEADYKIHQLISQQWEPIEEEHLLLESTNDNVDIMLTTALKYLKNDKTGN